MSESAESSRIENARRKSADAKRRLGVAAGVSFAAALLLAWVSHAGAQPAAGTPSDASSGREVQWENEFDFGTGLLSPPSGNAVPGTGTHVS